jgi:hypothetical protein
VDAYNALRKSTYGELAALPHQNAAAMLPADFADRFFPHDSHAGLTALTNPKDVQAKIDRLTKDVGAAQAHLASLQAKAAAKALRKQKEAEADAAVAAAKKAEADARQKTKDAEQAAKDAKKKPPPPAPAPPKGP